MKRVPPFLLTLLMMAGVVMSLSADDKPKEERQAEKKVRDTLAQLEKAEPEWQGHFETLVGLAKSGPAALPVLDETLKTGSGPARDFAAYALRVLRGPADVTRALANFDPKRIDTARLGQLAPDFTLSDPTGKAYRLSQFRGKKAVVLIFFITED